MARGGSGAYRWAMSGMGKIRGTKIAFTFRIDPHLKIAAKRAAAEAGKSLSKYVQNLIRLDLWRKGLLG